MKGIPWLPIEQSASSDKDTGHREIFRGTATVGTSIKIS
jgi:hypothetical protein